VGDEREISATLAGDGLVLHGIELRDLDGRREAEDFAQQVDDEARSPAQQQEQALMQDAWHALRCSKPCAARKGLISWQRRFAAWPETGHPSGPPAGRSDAGRARRQARWGGEPRGRCRSISEFLW
jgi:hypothetical protein